MRYLGIDYGKRWIGLALADTSIDIVLPIDPIENKGREKLFNELAEFLKNEKIDEVVVGVPFTLDSAQSEQTKETILFIKEFAERVKIPIREEDERLTSQGAAKLAVNGFGKETRMHSRAAMIILESFLARKKNGNI